MEEIKVPIYLMTGFLESGKTSFLNFTIQQDYFHTDGKTLLILCEEGEEEYDEAALKANNTVVEIIENKEDFTTERLVAMDILHQPERVIIEYNGMWLVSDFEKMQLPRPPEGTAFPRPVEERSAAAAAEHSSPRQQINVRAFLILAPQGIRTAENIKGGLRAEIHEKERRP